MVEGLLFEGRDRLDDGTPLSMALDVLVKAGAGATDGSEEKTEMQFDGRDRYEDGTPL